MPERPGPIKLENRHAERFARHFVRLETGLGASLHTAGYRALGLDFVYVPFAIRDRDADLAGAAIERVESERAGHERWPSTVRFSDPRRAPDFEGRGDGYRLQAAPQFELYTGRSAPLAAMNQALEAAL